MSLLSKRSALLAPFVLAGLFSKSSPATAGGTPLVWKTLPLLNTWTSYYRPIAIAVDPSGVIHIQGSVYQATPSNNSNVCRLPTSYRPSAYIYLATYTNEGTFGSIEIGTDGNIYAFSNPATNAQSFTSFENISFTK